MGLTTHSTKLKKMPQYNYRFEAIGTFFEIVTSKALTSDITEKLMRTVTDFDDYFSRFRRNSIVSRMAESAGVYSLPKGSERLFELYERLYEISKGKVSPLVGASLESLGYDVSYSLQNKGAIASARYEEVIKRQGSELQIIQPVLIDIGAAGKGYLVDCIARILEQEGIAEYLIDASGDILHKGKTVEIIGLEHPLIENRIIGQITLQNKALCASAVNRRAWGDGLHHIIDSTTGVPTQDVIATWVIADDAMIADGLATALFFTEPDLLKARYNYEYLRIKANGSIDFSSGFNGTLYKETA
jgi:FAD:protein FMN transferase